MPIISCPQCGKHIPASTLFCPFCARTESENSQPSQNSWLFWLTILLLSLGVIVSLLFSK